MNALEEIAVLSLSYRGGKKFTWTKPRPVDPTKEVTVDAKKDRPFTLPKGEFRPKQSLGQNFLSDQNYVLRICDSFEEHSEKGKQVVEIGPGAGALTRVLHKRYPEMTAVEIDQRSVAFLAEKLPQLKTVHQNVLEFDWAQHAANVGGKLSVIANLPYHVVSQVLFSLADNYKAIDKAVVTMQLEVGLRATARKNSKDYGIPSVALQLYSKPKMLFNIPPSVFYPKPKVDSALVSFDFTQQHPGLWTIDRHKLRKLVTTSFGQRRKMMRASLKAFLEEEEVVLSEKWATKRPEDLEPEEFLELTAELFGTVESTEHPNSSTFNSSNSNSNSNSISNNNNNNSNNSNKNNIIDGGSGSGGLILPADYYRSEPIWRLLKKEEM